MSGGSVTAGHNGGGPERAYPKLFIDYLNAKFPCTGDGGDAGEHVYKTTTPGNSMSHATSFSTISNLERIDLVIVEFNVNDHFTPGGSTVQHALEDKGPWGGTNEYRSLWYGEMLLRKLLLLQKPDYPAIVTFNADYIGGYGRAFPGLARQSLFQSNHEPLKFWLSYLYDIPVFSASLFHLALASKLGTDGQFNFNETRDGHNPYATSIWHADACCHPKKEGHRVLALVLIYNFADELWRMDHDGSVGHEDMMEGDFTIDPLRPRMRDPVYMSPEEDGLYVRGLSDLTDPNGVDAWRSKIVTNEGWTWFADNKDKDKYGLIADDRAGGQHVAFRVTGQEHGVVEVTFVVSYENFGIVFVWFDDKEENTRSDECLKGVGWKSGQQLSGIWGERASVPQAELLGKRLWAGESWVLHMCLTPHDGKRNWEGNKFKLLGMRMY